MGSMKDELGDKPYADAMKTRAYARPGDLQTSHEAAARVSPVINKLEAAVAAHIKSCGERGATWNEIAAGTGIDKGSISPRFKPLREQKKIKAATDPNDKIIKRDHQTVWIGT